jgi:Spy/CpxP family protein refolding chaperone
MKRILTGAMVFMLFAGSAQAQSKQDTARHHHKDGREMMAKQLNLTADQQSKLKTIHENERKEMEGLKTKSLTADQFKAQRKDLHKKYQDQVQAVFTPAQKAQMETFRAERKQNGGKKGQWQKGGNDMAKRGGEFQKELNLTQTQKDQLSKMRSEVKSQVQSIRNDQSLTQDQKKEKMHSLKKEEQQKFKSVLTKEQLDKLESMKKEHKDRATK